MTWSRLVAVAVRVPRLAVDRPFTYRVPDGLDAPIGSLVQVPFHGRAVQAWVLGPTEDVPPKVAEVRKVLSPVRFFDGRLLALYRWASARYLAPLATVIDRGVPPRVVSEEATPVAPGPAPRFEEAGPSLLGGYEHGGRLEASLASGGTTGAFLVRPLPGEEAALAVGAVARALAAGRTAIVLVPEAAPVPRTADLIREAFGGSAVLFLGGEPRERYRTWLDIIGGRYRVVVGTRPAVFAPLQDLGLLWVAREAHAGHREERSPSWHVRDLALARARIEGAVAVAAGLSPSLEAMARDDWDGVVRAPRAREHAAWPVVETVAPGPEGRAPRVVELLGRTDAAFLLSSRPGYGVARVCRRCGRPAACAACGGVLEQARGRVTCRSCRAPGRCATCGSESFGVLRRGAERVAEWARGIATVPVEEVAEGPGTGPRVWVGTSAAVRDVGPLRLRLVAILDADRMRARPGLSAPEQVLATWFEAAAWAGPRAAGRVIVETREPGDGAVQALVRTDPWVFAAREAGRRAEAGFPPGHPVFRLAGAAGLSEDLAAFEPVNLLVTRAGDEEVCLLTVRPDQLPELGERVRAWARSGRVRRIDAEPHL